MARIDPATVVTLVFFFIVGLLAGGQLRGDVWPTQAAPVLLDGTDATAPAAGPRPFDRPAGVSVDASASSAAPATPATPATPRTVAYQAPSPRAAPARAAYANASIVPKTGVGANKAPYINPFRLLVPQLEQLPLERSLLPREPDPPTTLQHIMSNASSTPLLPEVFVPCCAKTGTTFLWECTSKIFDPSLVCGANKVDAWTPAKCHNRKYVLKGYRIVPGGCRAERKEYFFWGGGKGEDAIHFPHKGMRWYAGMPTPLYYWQRNARMCHKPSDVERLCYQDLPEDIPFSQIKRPKNRVEQVPEGGRIHPACKRLKFSRPQSPKPGERVVKHDDLMVECAVPWVDKRTHPNAVNMDFTPNHLFDPITPTRLYDNMPDPTRLKFVVTLRNPVKRAYSEWSMFVKWNWERTRDFGKRIQMEIAQLRRCNATIFDKPSLVFTLPHDQFSAYHKKCFTGQAMEYVRNGMYINGFRNFMRLFDASQFLIIWSEVSIAARARARQGRCWSCERATRPALTQCRAHPSPITGHERRPCQRPRPGFR